MGPLTQLEGRYGFDETKLNKLYTKCKILAMPYDYTLKDRAIPLADFQKFSNVTSVFYKGKSIELWLCGKLGLKNHWVPCQIEDAVLPYDATTGGYHLSDDTCALQFLNDAFKNIAYMYKYNDMLFNDDSLDETLNTYGVSVLEPLIKLHCLMESKSVITNQLTLSRLTGVSTESLNDVVNLKFVERSIDSGEGAYLIAAFTQDLPGTYFLQTFALGMHVGYPKSSTSELINSPWKDGVYAESLRQNLITAGMYFCEFVRVFNNMPFNDRAKLERLFFENRMTGSTSFTDAFGRYDVVNKVFKSPELEDIVKSNADKRYHEIPKYVSDCLHKTFPKIYTWNDTTIAAATYLDIYVPDAFVRLYSNLYHHAWEDFRVKQFILLVNKCKEKGIDISELNTSPTSGGDGSLSYLDDDSEANEFEAFGDMTRGVTYDDDTPAEDKAPSKKPPATPTLETMDNLLKSCSNEYEFEIEDVPNDPSYKDAYGKILAPIEMITKQLTKQIRNIKTYNVGGKHTGKSRGKIDPHTMYRYKTDPKIFYDTSYKIREMDLAFGIILDQSGSMRGDGITNGKISLILLHHVLNALRINHSIIGHTSKRYHQSKIMRYVLFNEDPKHKLDVPCVLANLKAQCGNCDSGALNYMEQYIKRTNNKDKIVLIFSDGEPTECSETELKEQVRQMEKEGIHVIGLGIDFDNIKFYYPDHANGRNLKEMVDILVKILKRYVLEKKD